MSRVWKTKIFTFISRHSSSASHIWLKSLNLGWVRAAIRWIPPLTASTLFMANKFRILSLYAHCRCTFFLFHLTSCHESRKADQTWIFIKLIGWIDMTFLFQIVSVKFRVLKPIKKRVPLVSKIHPNKEPCTSQQKIDMLLMVFMSQPTNLPWFSQPFYPAHGEENQ